MLKIPKKQLDERRRKRVVQIASQTRICPFCKRKVWAHSSWCAMCGDWSKKV